MQKLTLAMTVMALAVLGSTASAQSLKGSRASMERQNQQAVSYGYTFLETPDAVAEFVSQGHLVRIDDSATLELHDVSYPYARPQIKKFIDRFSDQYSKTCGEKLTVTSLTRPIDEQPVNASSDSVHPTGMAVDMRVPSGGSCRKWLERTLLSMERAGVLDVTRERHPSHYHVAVFTQSYENYVADQAAAAASPVIPAPTLIAAASATKPKTIAAQPVSTKQPQASALQVTHKVKEGETLWEIATLYGTSAKKIKKLNGLRTSVLQVGQVLRINSASLASSG